MKTLLAVILAYFKNKKPLEFQRFFIVTILKLNNTIKFASFAKS